MSNIHRKAYCTIAVIALSLGANGIALADPAAAGDSNAAIATSDSQCNDVSLPCAGASRSLSAHDQTQPHHRAFAFHRARLHSVSQQRAAAAEARNGPSPVVVAYNWGSAAQSPLSCRGENSWSLLCPGAGVIGVSY
jgi:hypothetical protein